MREIIMYHESEPLSEEQRAFMRSPLISEMYIPLGMMEHHEQTDKKRYGVSSDYPCYIMINDLDGFAKDFVRLINFLCESYANETRIILYTCYEEKDVIPFDGHATCWVFEKHLGRSYLFSFDGIPH